MSISSEELARLKAFCVEATSATVTRGELWPEALCSPLLVLQLIEALEETREDQEDSNDWSERRRAKDNVAAQGENKRLRAALEASQKREQRYTIETQNAYHENDRLRAQMATEWNLLVRYGRHESYPPCDILGAFIGGQMRNFGELPCSCGLDDALAALEGTP